MSTFIRIKGWEKYQHYRDRNPPWIKLHQELLTSLTWALADNASRVLAVALMMLAAKTGNKIPANADYVKRVAYLHETPDFSQLLQLEFIEFVDDSGTIKTDASRPLAVARPEKETEKEEETEAEQNAAELPNLQLARKVIEELALSCDSRMLDSVAGAIQFCRKIEGKGANAAVEFLIAHGKDEIDRGRAPTKFWFDDRKWRMAAGYGGKKSKLERNLDELSTLD